MPRITFEDGMEMCRLAQEWGYHAVTPVRLSVLPDTTLTKGDIPASLARERIRHPGLAWSYGRPLGPHPALLDLLAARIAEQRGGERAGPPPAVLLAGRGSTDPDANAEVCKTARLLWEGRDYPLAETAFVSLARPDIPAGLERCRLLGARHVIVSGDVRARSLLLGHLATPLRESATVLDEEVSADSQAMTEAADRALSEWAGRHCRERFDDWQARLAHGLAVQGLARTMAAFRDGQVSDLFLADDPSSTASAWIGPAGNDLAASRDELLELDVPAPAADRADAAIVRAIAHTDAELHFLPADLVETGNPEACGGIARPLDGVCATLRFSLESS